MNIATQQFVESLQARPDVLGIILFGSWARGNNRPDSDVDLLVIVQEGFRRSVEEHAGQTFEIIYTTEQGAIDFWHSSPDEAVELWTIARVLFDRDGTMVRLKAVGEAIRAARKSPLSEETMAHLTFDVRDQIKTAEALAPNDPITARMLLNMKLLHLTELFFDVRQLWTPPPKQRLAVIRQHDAGLYERIAQFYNAATLEEQIALARQIAETVLKK